MVATLPDLQDLLLHQRGVTPPQQSAWFRPDYHDLHDPYAMHDMAAAVNRMYQAIERRERVIVYGDYDVDGLAGTAMVVSVVRQLGGIVMPFLPHRVDHGYGLHQAVLEQLAAEFDILITVDCGISNTAEITWLKQQKKTVIVLDHHELPPTLPPADAILHPRHPHGAYPFPWLCGAGVAWKFCVALIHDERSHWSKPDKDEREKRLLDLATLGTVADMVPLMGENRILVSHGLEAIRTTARRGLQQLLVAARLGEEAVTAEQLSWRLLPRLNAVGKMGHAQPALDLLLTEDVDQADQLVAVINSHNQERQTVTRRIVQEAESLISPTAAVLVAADPSWPPGVVGLVAGQLVNKYNRPAVVIGGNGQHAVGSARAPVGGNILALLRTAADCCLKLGGHARAAGFSLKSERITEFKERLQAQAEINASPVDVPAHVADAVISSALLTWRTLQLLEQMAPFGEGNKRPLFIVRDLPLHSWRPVGKQEQHAKYLFVVDEEPLGGIGFNLAPAMKNISGLTDAVVSLSANTYRGRRSLQVEVQDIVSAGHATIR